MNIASFVRLIATVFWLGTIGFLVLAILRSGQNRPIRRSGVILISAFAISILFTILGMGLVFIEPQERGVVISALNPEGYRSQPLEPGLEWIVPGLENVQRYSIAKQTYTMSLAQLEGAVIGDDSITARTSDGQQIYVDASVIYSINPNEVVNVHIAWQDRFNEGLVRPVSRAVIRDAVSQFGVQEVYSTEREQLTAMITEDMRIRLAESGLTLDQFLLRNITFSDEYAASVEQKQIAEQLAQQAELTVEQRRQEAEQARQEAQGLADAAVIKAKGEAEARVIQAEAEANALELIAAVLQNNPDLLTYQYITKLSPNIQAMLLPSNAPFLFPLPEMEEQTTTMVPTPSIMPTAVPEPESTPDTSP